jgi:transcriptional regulator with XRE-family HTH domain
LDLKLTKRQLSLRLNVSDITIYLWEKNKVEPSLATFPKIISFLKYNPLKTTPKSFGEKIAGFRKTHGISQKRLARLLGIDPSTVGAWERAENQPSRPLLDKLILFFKFFPCS